MSKVPTYLSYDPTKNNLARDSFIQHTRESQSLIEVTTYSIVGRFDERWKTNTKDRIRKNHLVIALIGEETYLSEGIIWEITCVKEYDIPVIGVLIDKQGNIPKKLSDGPIIEWDDWNRIENFAKVASSIKIIKEVCAGIENRREPNFEKARALGRQIIRDQREFIKLKDKESIELMKELIERKIEIFKNYLKGKY